MVLHLSSQPSRKLFSNHLNMYNNCNRTSYNHLFSRYLSSNCINSHISNCNQSRAATSADFTATFSAIFTSSAFAISSSSLHSGQNISRPQGQFQYQPGPHAFQFPYQQGQQPKSLQPLVGQELNESQAAHQLGQQLQGSQQSEQQVQRLQASNAMQEPGQKSQSPTAVQQYGMQPHVQNFLKQQDMLQQGPPPSQQQLPPIGFPRLGDSGVLPRCSNRLLTICYQV
ncbi:hypothetical protein HPP92_010329 [Vanilla planifolia]|uniref:Uncharacterized protein n=1 Tax=Vanilla planifolia TaxID=51239 RepID=A0A835V3C6_VANPL|nr:hypothetical protein HPP92_010329 [Vanilla planifolia]